VDGAQITAMIVAAVGTGGILTSLINNAASRASGKTEKERGDNASMKAQRDDAVMQATTERTRASDEQRRADCLSRNANRWANHAARLERMLIAAPCVDTTTIPPNPKNLE
jgi:hypothetical protein